MGKLKDLKIRAHESMIDIIDEMTLDAWDEVEDYIENRKLELQEDIVANIESMFELDDELSILDTDDYDLILEDEIGTDLAMTIDDYIYTNWGI